MLGSYVERISKIFIYLCKDVEYFIVRKKKNIYLERICENKKTIFLLF